MLKTDPCMSEGAWLYQNAVNEGSFMIASAVISNTELMEVARFSEEVVLLTRTEQIYLPPTPP